MSSKLIHQTETGIDHVADLKQQNTTDPCYYIINLLLVHSFLIFAEGGKYHYLNL